jgi:hypothetical protein
MLPQVFLLFSRLQLDNCCPVKNYCKCYTEERTCPTLKKNCNSVDGFFLNLNYCKYHSFPFGSLTSFLSTHNYNSLTITQRALYVYTFHSALTNVLLKFVNSYRELTLSQLFIHLISFATVNLKQRKQLIAIND